jgi:GntR family transcriptional regulator
MLDPTSPVPLYHQVENRLRSLIEHGEWLPGQAIPPERELVERFGVSRITIRQAIAHLVTDGLLYRQHGRGTFVARNRPAVIAESLTHLTGHLEELQMRGLAPRVDLLSLDQKPITGPVADALQRPPGTVGWHLVRRIFVAEEPLMVSEIYLPIDLGIQLHPQAVEQMAISRLLEEAGLLLLTGTQRISAGKATAEEARLLGIAPDDPVLQVVRVMSGQASVPLVWLCTRYRSDRYAYEVELKRRR